MEEKVVSYTEYQNQVIENGRKEERIRKVNRENKILKVKNEALRDIIMEKDKEILELKEQLETKKRIDEVYI